MSNHKKKNHASILGVLAFVSVLCTQPNRLFAQQSEEAAPVSTERLLELYKEYNAKREVADGYRVQITFTDIREDAYKSKAAVYKQFADYPAYVEYDQPYYKLRVGDFATRLEATSALQQIITVYPGAYIVKDRIKLK